MASVLALSVCAIDGGLKPRSGQTIDGGLEPRSGQTIDGGLEPRSGQTKHYGIDICCFSSKHATFRSKRKDWLTLNQDHVY